MSPAVRRLLGGFVRLAVLLWLIALPSAAWAGGSPDLPFRPGDQVVGGWTVKGYVAHAEFIRFTLGRSGQSATIELVADPSPAGEWTTGRHRLQPGPGARPDEALLRGLMPAVRQWDAHQSRSVVVPIGTSDPLVEAGRADAPVLHSFRAAGAFWVGGCLWLMAAALCWLHWARRREYLAMLGAAPLLAGLAVWLLRWPIGVQWLHLLHEAGDPLTAMLQPEDHAGLLPSVLRALWPEHPQLWTGLARAAHAQVWIVGLAGVGLLLWAARRVPLWVAAGVLIGLSASPAWWRAVLSELPSAWVALLVWGALASWDLWRSAQTLRPWRWLAGFHLVLTSIALWQTRPELGLAGIVLTAGADPTVRSRLDRALDRLAKLLATHTKSAAALALTLVIVGVASNALWTGRFYWMAAAVNPLQWTTVEAVVASAACLPVAWTAICVHALYAERLQTARWQAASLWAAAVLVAVAKLYVSATHSSWYEAQRYMSMLAPFLTVAVVAALAVVGHALSHRPRVRSAVWLSMCLPGIPLLAAPFFQVQGDDPWPWQPLDRDRQLEARFVHDVVALAPDCALVARALQTEANSQRLRDRWVLARPDAPHLFAGDLAAGIAPLLAPGPALQSPKCLIELRLLDCYRLGANLCPAPQPASQVLLERRWTSRPYIDPIVHGAFARHLHLQAWRVDLGKL